MSGYARTLIGAATAMLLALSGCVGAVTEGANITRDKLVVKNNMEAARAGSAEAQYKVGNALCCSLDEGGEGFYDTPQSVAWLCRAAAQDYGPAARKLGEIYSGDTISGVRVLRRVAAGVAGSSTNGPVAYAWFRRAEVLHVEGVLKPASRLWEKFSPAERAEADALANGRQPLPCEWRDVIHSS